MVRYQLYTVQGSTADPVSASSLIPPDVYLSLNYGTEAFQAVSPSQRVIYIAVLSLAQSCVLQTYITLRPLSRTQSGMVQQCNTTLAQSIILANSSVTLAEFSQFFKAMPSWFVWYNFPVVGPPVVFLSLSQLSSSLTHYVNGVNPLVNKNARRCTYQFL